MFGKTTPEKRIEDLETQLEIERTEHDAVLSRTIKRDTDIINGLLAEIDALHLLLEKQSQNGDSDGGQCRKYIRNCQNMLF